MRGLIADELECMVRLPDRIDLLLNGDADAKDADRRRCRLALGHGTDVHATAELTCANAANSLNGWTMYRLTRPRLTAGPLLFADLITENATTFDPEQADHIEHVFTARAEERPDHPIYLVF